MFKWALKAVIAQPQDKDFDTNQSASEELTESCDLVACLELLLPTILQTTKGLLAIWDMNNFGFAE